MSRHLPRRSCRGSSQSSRSAGFTLVEVIVALAILSIGLSLLLGLISNSLRRTANADRIAEAALLAQSLLAEVGTTIPIKLEQRDGLYPNGYRWHLKTQVYDAARQRDDSPVSLYAVSSEIEWNDGSAKRSIVLRTLRLAPSGQQ